MLVISYIASALRIGGTTNTLVRVFASMLVGRLQNTMRFAVYVTCGDICERPSLGFCTLCGGLEGLE